MNCKCGKPLVQREVAISTKTIGDDIIVLQSRTAQVCDECGVVAWGTRAYNQPFSQPFRPYQNPPWAIPAGPVWTPSLSPNSATPMPRLPQIWSTTSANNLT